MIEDKQKLIAKMLHFGSKNRSTTFVLLLAATVVLFFLANGNQWVKNAAVYQKFFDSFALAVADTTAFFLRLTGKEINYVPVYKAYDVGTPILLSMNTTFALRYFVFIFVILLLLPGQYFKSFLFFLFSAILLFLALVFRNFFEILYNGERMQAISQWAVVARPTIVMLALAFKYKHSVMVRSIYQKMNISFRSRFLVSLYPFVFVIMVAEPLSRVFEVFNLDFFAALILFKTHMLASLMGFETIISNRYIYLEQFWVYMGDPCLGIGVGTIFIFLIATLRGQTLNKIIFIAIGLYILLLMNAVRVLYILLDLRNLQSAALGYDAHEMSNYFFYFVVFLLLNVYMFWFDNINFRTLLNKKPHKN